MGRKGNKAMRRPRTRKARKLQQDSEQVWFDEFQPLKLEGRGLTQNVLSSIDARNIRKLLSR